MFRNLIIAILVSVCACRVFETSMKFTNFGRHEGWIYLDKMSFAPGTVEYKIKTEPKGIPYGSGGTVTL